MVCGWVVAGEVVAQDVGGAEAPGTYLAVTTQPQANVPGTPLARQPVVEVRYADGTRFADYNGPVTAYLSSGNAGVLSGTTTVMASSGVATFTDLVLTGVPDEPYTLTFSGPTIVFESFSYAPSSLLNQDGGFGWDGAWLSSSGAPNFNDFAITASSLSYPGFASFGGKASWSSGFADQKRTLAVASNSVGADVVWFSFLGNYTREGGGFNNLRLFDQSGLSGALGGNDNYAHWTLLNDRLRASTYSTAPLDGTTRLALLKIDYAQGSSALWMDPDPATFDPSSTPDVSQTFAPVIKTIHLFNRYTGVSTDEISLSYSWEGALRQTPVIMSVAAAPMVHSEVDLNASTVTTPSPWVPKSATRTVTVTLYGSDGERLMSSGGTVSITASAGTIGPVTDHSDGTYTADFTAPSSSSAVLIAATLDGQSIGGTQTAYVGAPNGTLSVQPTTTTLTTATIAWTYEEGSVPSTQTLVWVRFQSGGPWSLQQVLYQQQPPDVRSVTVEDLIPGDYYTMRIWPNNPNGDQKVSGEPRFFTNRYGTWSLEGTVGLRDTVAITLQLETAPGVADTTSRGPILATASAGSILQTRDEENGQYTLTYVANEEGPVVISAMVISDKDGTSRGTIDEHLFFEVLNEAPIVTSGQAFAYGAGRTAGFEVGAVQATDEVRVAAFEITAGNDAGYFQIDTSGRLTLTSAGAGDAPSNRTDVEPNTFSLAVTATDPSGITSTPEAITISVVEPMALTVPRRRHLSDDTLRIPVSITGLAARQLHELDFTITSAASFVTIDDVLPGEALGAIAPDPLGPGASFLVSPVASPSPTYRVHLSSPTPLGQTSDVVAYLPIRAVDVGAVDFSISGSRVNGAREGLRTATESPLVLYVDYGDLDQNGMVRALDAAHILRNIVGHDPPLGTTREIMANVDGSVDSQGGRTVTSLDASLILQHVVLRLTCFPVEACPSKLPHALSTPKLDVDIRPNPLDPRRFLVAVDVVEGTLMALDVELDEGNLQALSGVPEGWTYAMGSNRLAMAGDGAVSNLLLDVTTSTSWVSSDRSSPTVILYPNGDPTGALRQSIATATPETVRIEAVYPVPFRETGIIEIALPAAMPIRLDIVDLMGRRVQHVAEAAFSAGVHQFQVDGATLPSGIYLVRLSAAGKVQVRRMVHL